jgi:hypothetical protein
MGQTEDRQCHKEQLERALAHARRVLRYSKRAKKALEKVRRCDIATDSVDAFVESRTSVEKLLGKTGSTELESELDDWLQATTDEVAQICDQRQRELLTTLRAHADDHGVEFRKLGDSPPSVSFGPIQIVLEPGQYAQLKLGLEPICRATADPDSILESIDHAREQWDARTPDSPELFERLRRAYLMSCSRDGLSPGDRVDVVDLLGPLALLETKPKSFRKQGLASLEEYPRHLLARQLSILNRERLLKHAGYRLELGAATGGSTQDKRRVLYVQSTPSRGQYFLTIRFTQR